MSTWAILYQNAQPLSERITPTIVWWLALLVAIYTAIITRDSQKRNERFLAYQFKLNSLNNKSDKMRKKVNTMEDVVNLGSWINATTPWYSLENLKRILDNKKEYSDTYDKMVKRFNLKDL